MNDPSAQAVAIPKRRSTPIRLLKIAATTALVFYFAWCTGMYFVQERLIFANRAGNAWKKPPESMPSVNIAGIPVWTAGEELIDVQDEGGPRLRGVAVLLHGNADRAARLAKHGPEVPELVRSGWVIIAPEYPGYAGRDGTPSQAQIVNECGAVVDAIRKRVGKDTPIAYIGYSLGGGVACALAERVQPDALVLRNTFTSVSAMAWSYGVPPFLVKHPFDNAAYLKSSTTPTLIIHAGQDHIIPLAHARRLHEIKPDAAYHELAGDHFEYRAPAEYGRLVREWLDATIPDRRTKP